jgi:transposase InsO family protein
LEVLTGVKGAAQVCREHGIYAGRIIRTIKKEEIDLADYQDFADAYAQIRPFVEQVYQHKRIHSALGHLTPTEFEAQWRSQQSRS